MRECCGQSEVRTVRHTTPNAPTQPQNCVGWRYRKNYDDVFSKIPFIDVDSLSETGTASSELRIVASDFPIKLFWSTFPVCEMTTHHCQ